MRQKGKQDYKPALESVTAFPSFPHPVCFFWKKMEGLTAGRIEYIFLRENIYILFYLINSWYNTLQKRNCVWKFCSVPKIIIQQPDINAINHIQRINPPMASFSWKDISPQTGNRFRINKRQLLSISNKRANRNNSNTPEADKESSFSCVKADPWEEISWLQ